MLSAMQACFCDICGSTLYVCKEDRTGKEMVGLVCPVCKSEAVPAIPSLLEKLLHRSGEKQG